MFEKEAKLRVKDYTEDKKRQIAYECGFLDGTDFAYNKAYLENKKLKEGLAVGSILNRALNSRNTFLEEERDKYRNMVFDLLEKKEEAIEIIKSLLSVTNESGLRVCDMYGNPSVIKQAGDFINKE